MKRWIGAGLLALGPAPAFGQEAPPVPPPVDVRVMQAIDDLAAPLAVGPEHEVLHAWSGTWDVTTRSWAGAGRVMTGRGVQTCRIVLGGLAITCEFGEAGADRPFLGHLFATWNPREKKHESYWMDSMSHGGTAHARGTWDAATKTMTEVQTVTDKRGRAHTLKLVTVFAHADRHVTTFFDLLPDGRERRTLEIVYTRRH